MSNLAVVQQSQHSAISAVEIRAQVNLIQEVMKAVMKEEVHYGVIPGCAKPSLYKPGSEKLLSTFRIAIEPIVEDLSTPDEARYRVTTRATSMENARYLGSGVGEASSAEEKYQWRAAVCEQEFEETPEDRRRNKWKGSKNGAYQVKQVRTNVADVANTVLKMAKKRSQIDVTLTVTAASDIFAQDIEDLPEEYRSEMTEGEEAPAPVQQTQRKEPEPAKPAAQPHQGGKRVISENQGKRFYAMRKGGKRTDDEVRAKLAEYGFKDSREITVDKYDELCTWVNQ
jgi:hypothetical protein